MVEDLVRGLWSIARYFVVELFWSIVLFPVGRAFLLLVTLGRFPRSRDDLENDEEAIALAGGVEIVAALAVVFR